MRVLTQKRIDTIEALRERFGNPENVTRDQIMTAMDEGLIDAFPYWMTDDLTLKVDRGSWHLLTPDEFRKAEKGESASLPMTKRMLKALGREVPSFLKPKPDVPKVPGKRGRKPKAKPEVVPVLETQSVQEPVVEVTKVARKRKPKMEKIVVDAVAPEITVEASN